MSGFNETLKLYFGFLASNGKYLTSDGFGSGITATGADMKKKQIFTVAQCDGYVNLVAPNGKFLTAGQKGELTAACDTPGDDEKWTLSSFPDGSWAFKSNFGYYLSNKGEEMNSFARDTNDGSGAKFSPRLSNHPQVCIRHSARKSYVHLERGQLNATELIPWGVDAMLTLIFDNGAYAIQASNCKYLKNDGSLVDAITADCRFIMEFSGEKVCFKSASNNKYLQCSGADGKAMVKSDTIGNNENFTIEDSHPQITMSTAGKFVTWGGGVDVKCTADAAGSDKEIWQMEINKSNGKWAFRNDKGGYWKLNGTSVYTEEKCALDQETSWFDIEWLGSQLALKGSNGKYVTRKANGALAATADNNGDDNSKFVFALDNRPQLVMKTDFGFLAVKTVQGQPTVTCNNMVGDVFNLEVKNGACAIKKDGKYLKLQADGSLTANGETAEFFYLELPVHTKFALKSAATGKYAKAEQTGAFKCSANNAKDNTALIEY